MTDTKTRSDTEALGDRLKAYCKVAQFAPGEMLREKGQHYSFMYLVTEGDIEVDLGVDGGKIRPAIGPLALPIGEIGFLQGVPAGATVRAISEATALHINDAVLTKIETENPDLAVELLRFLATTAEERTSHNIALLTDLDALPKDPSIQIVLCRDREMLREAMKLRYQVYCRELGRQSPHADHDKEIITDHLDDFGHTFLAVENDRAIGTLRSNHAADGDVGILEDLYGMGSSEFHPQHTVVCTKFIIAKDKRTSVAGLKLVAAFTRFSVQQDLRECYIDCIPSLKPYYMAMGFRSSGEKFLHRENGPSYPMVVDLVKHRKRMERVLWKL